MALAAQPGLTLGELLDGDLGLELVGGAAGARARRVAGAHSIEIDHPANWLGPGWLMLTTGMRLRHRAGAQRQLVAELDDIGAAAVGFGVDVAFKAVPPALLDEARVRGLPVFSIPLRTPFRDVISAVNASVLSREVRATRRLSSLQLYLMDALEEEHPSRAVIERLGAFVDATVTLFSADGRVAGSTAPAPTEAIWLQITRRPAALMQFEDDGWETVATPLRRHGSWLAVSSSRSQPLPHVTRAAVRATAPVLAALARLDDRAMAQEQAIRSATLDALLDGDDPDHGSLAARAATLGLDGSAPARVVLLGPRARGAALETALQQRALPFLAGTRRDKSVCLVQAPAGEIRAAVAQALAGHPRAAGGVGRAATGPAAIPQSLRDAEIALERARTDPANRLLTFEDLDLATLIATEASTERFKPKVDELIGALDAHRGLFDVVVAYFAHDLDVMRTAQAMGVHHNSLRYRLGRVEQILGHSLKDPATIASLYLALAGTRR